MTAQERIDRADGLYTLMTNRSGEDFAETPACAAAGDPDVFFPISSNDEVRISAAREICAGCPLQDACLDRALRVGEAHGVWGGKTEWERDELLRARPERGVPAQVAASDAADAVDVVAGSREAVDAGAKRAVAALERVAGRPLPLLRRRVTGVLVQKRGRNESAEQMSGAVLAVLRPQLEQFGGAAAVEGVAA